MINVLLTLFFSCLTFMGFGNPGLFFHWDDYYFIFWSQPQIQLSSEVMILDNRVSSSEAIYWSSMQTLTYFCIWSAIRILLTNVAAMFFNWNFLICPKTSSHHFTKLLNGQTLILICELLYLCKILRSCACQGPVWSSPLSSTDIRLTLNSACHISSCPTKTSLTKHLLNLWQFDQYSHKLWWNSLFLFYIHLEMSTKMAVLFSPVRPESVFFMLWALYGRNL